MKVLNSKCQNCECEFLVDLLFLGYVPPVNSMEFIGSNPKEFSVYPLNLSHCQECELTQLASTPEMRTVFPLDYPYRSKVTKVLVENFKEQAELARHILNLDRKSLVIDIGSNDGTLLSQYKSFTRVLGVEPTTAATDSYASGIPTLNEFFDSNTCKTILREHGKADLITACNVFAHIPHMKNLITDIRNLLTDDGVFLSESHYLDSLVDTLQFDTIYHEHLRYYSIAFLKNFLESNKLKVFRIDKINTHGGSIRVWASKNMRIQVDVSVQDYLGEEIERGNCSLGGLIDFGEKTVEWRFVFLELLMRLRKEKKTIAGLGAPSRASTLISYCGLSANEVYAVGELNSSKKIGRYIPGTRIPITDEKNLIQNPPDYLIIFSWHIASTVMKNIVKQGYRGLFVVPLPVPRIVSWEEIEA